MAGLRRFLLRLWNAITPRRAERELAREVAAHLALLEDEYRRRGLDPTDAQRAARRALGGVEPAKDWHRDARSFVWVDDVRRDVAYAARLFVRAPGFAFIVCLTLALGIGANTAIFTIVDHVLFRALPLPDPDRVVRLYESKPSADRQKELASIPNLADWRRATQTLDLITPIGGTSATLTGAAEPESLTGMQVGPAYFDLTGITLALGRPFEPAEYQSMANAALGSFPGSDPNSNDAVVIISHALWHRQFGGDLHVVGRRVKFNGRDARIVGVMPADVWLKESTWGVADFWVPLVESRMAAQRRFRQFAAIGRLKPDVTIEAARAEMTTIAAGLEREYPADNAGWGVDVLPLQATITGDARPTLLILFGGVACVLLIACANIANLFLMRATGRTREAAIRMAIGAGRSRLVRQWVTESVLLAAIGGLGGFMCVLWAVPVLVAYAPSELPRIDEIAVDGRVLAFSITTALVAGLLCGLIPAIGARATNIAVLRSSGAAATTTRRRWLRPSLVLAEVGLAVVLLVGAGLMARTLIAVTALDPGFDPERVLTFNVGLRGLRYRGLAAVRDFSQDLVERLESVPGVRAAGVGGLPFLGSLNARFLVEGRDEPLTASMNVPSPGYFAALGVRLRSGRVFNNGDGPSGPLVAIVNESFARDAWGTKEVLGRRVRTDYNPPTWLTVVGVVSDMRTSSLEADAPPAVFVPNQQSVVATFSSYVLKTHGDPLDAVPAVRAAVRQIDDTLAISQMATMEERMAEALQPRRFNLWLVGLFSVIALVLATVGVYGIISEGVASRTTEIGVRVALGATTFQVVRLVVGGNLLIVAAGAGLGLVASTLAAPRLGSMLYGVEPIDPLTLAAVLVAFSGAAGLAALVPVRRAVSVDPVIALRGE